MLPYIDIHTHHEKSDNTVFQLLNKIIGRETVSDKVYSVGIHPWYVDTDYNNQFLILENIAQQANVLAIGECGLDKICPTNWEIQIKIFEKQIQLAKDLQKPLIIHAVKSYQEIFEILKAQQVHIPVLFHGFNKKKELAQSILQQDYYISLGTSILNGAQDSLIQSVDLSKIFLETDNKSINIVDIYSYFCRVRNISVEQLQQQLVQNLSDVFHYNIVA